MDIKEMLQSGHSAEEIRKMVDDEITNTQTELEKEKKAKASLADSRAKVIDSMLEYVQALTGDENVVSEENKKEIEAWLKRLEHRLTMYAPMTNFWQQLEKDGHAERRFHTPNSDAVIQAFVENLK